MNRRSLLRLLAGGGAAVAPALPLGRGLDVADVQLPAPAPVRVAIAPLPPVLEEPLYDALVEVFDDSDDPLGPTIWSYKFRVRAELKEENGRLVFVPVEPIPCYSVTAAYPMVNPTMRMSIQFPPPLGEWRQDKVLVPKVAPGDTLTLSWPQEVLTITRAMRPARWTLA